MGQYTESVVQFLKYSLKVLPELRQQNSNINGQNICPACVHSNASICSEAVSPAKEPHMAKLLGTGFFALYPETDLKSALSFILSLHKLSDTLAAYRTKAEITEEPELRKLYSCLSSAVDPSRSISCTFDNLSKAASKGQKSEQAHFLCMSDQCRLQLAVLPSFSLVALKLKKYMQFHVDLHSYMYYPEETRSEYLQTWSDYYLKRYPGISIMEFCAASDSLLGIIAMYTSASNPKLTSMELKLLDEACFPWLCGLESLLHSYVTLRLTENSKQLNYCSSYKNLKECEERLTYFAKKAEEACMKLKESNFYISLIRMILGIYLSVPDANFGMHRLTSLNILKNGPRRSILCCNACKLLHFYRKSK
jgi:tetraprenyl-beta-curcumene synthase